MKKTLVSLLTLIALSVGMQIASAACPCENPCPGPCPVAACPCNPCCDPCPAACPTPTESCLVQQPKCKCTWWKIFEDKSCCYKCNNECPTCCSAKRAHWYKFWTDRCVVKNVQCDKCKCDSCCD